MFTCSYHTLLALVQTQAVAGIPQFRQSLASDGGWSQSRGRLVVWLGYMVDRNGRWTFADELAGTSEQQHTVRWPNFDRLDPKMGVFLRGTEATPCGHVLK
jgi:hypothetical protein